MNHKFIPSQLDNTKCANCKFPPNAHDDSAQCEACGKITICDIYIDMLFCIECIEKEKNFDAARENNSDKRVEEMETDLVERSRAIDQSLQIRTDLFNAATIAIVDLKKAIDEDPTIENKNYKLAEELDARFRHFRSIIFDLDERRLQLANEQRAIQVYLNDLASKLRKEEREKLRLQDINYQPRPIKIDKPKTFTKRKLDKAELKKYANELGISEFTLQTIVVSKGVTVEQAANILRKAIKESKSEHNIA